ncbi:MAG TPA: N-methyl-L-tryptophan oxidase [Chthoniobacterales bacterium]|nr:N-methyl-L-tryptophan oxidase [Chthoniobacterales bacterium]
MKVFDVAVLGVGGIGSAACYHLARAGLRVLGIEQFSIPHARGSSHGITRILRQGLHENEVYVPLVRRGLELWRDLEKTSSIQLFYQTGSLDIGQPESSIVTRSLNSCRRFDVPYEELTADDLRRRYPVLSVDNEMVGIHQPGSGFVLAEASITAHVNAACACGAEIHGHEKMTRWAANQSGYTIETTHDRYEAGQIVFTLGAWVQKVVGKTIRVRPERAVLGWFQPRKNAALFGSLPVWIIDSPQAGHFYGLPIFGIPGFKLGRLSVNLAEVDPDTPLAEPDSRDEKDLRQFLEKHFPDANGPVLSMQTALFEHSPDRQFIIDGLPGFQGAWVIAGLSGHGFKYASGLGELAKDLVVYGKSKYDLTAFRLDRFTG